MPYVEVWVDDEPCDGTCESSKTAEKLQAMVDEAVQFLRDGDAEAALHALTDDGSIPMKSPSMIKSGYALWKAGKLPGFTNYVAAE